MIRSHSYTPPSSFPTALRNFPSSRKKLTPNGSRRSLKVFGYQTQTERIFSTISKEEGVGGAGGRTTYGALKRADEMWYRMKSMEGNAGPRPDFVEEHVSPLRDAFDFDVVVCGGTLGVFVACSLQKRGLKVAVVERGTLKGRKQEWNISRKELNELQEIGVLTAEEVESCINIEWSSVRSKFYGGPDIWTTDVLNLGVSPEKLVDKCKRSFLDAGGMVFESTPLSRVHVHDNGVALELGSGQSNTRRIACRLVLDCMGNFSPIVRQIRHGQKPDGVCLVVGTLAEGFQNNTTSDLIATTSPSMLQGKNVQYFWEAFPAGSGASDRTTYMFAYMDASIRRPSLEEMFSDYWELMPRYQNVALDDLDFKRAMFGFFPTYKDAPLRPGFDHILQIGDAGGLQSPLSFGGFGAMLRHLKRITLGVEEALEVNALDRSALGLLNAYNPGISGTWMMQKAMSVRDDTPPNFINTLLSNNFKAMEGYGDPVLKPFLQDVPQFKPLALTLLAQVGTDPLFVVQIFRSVGIDALVEWFPHFGNLGLYGLLFALCSPLRPLSKFLPPRDGYRLRRVLDSWEYGSGADYQL